MFFGYQDDYDIYNHDWLDSDDDLLDYNDSFSYDGDDMSSYKQCKEHIMKNYVWERLDEDRKTDQLFCDLSVMVDQREFKVHKCVLGLASEFFKTMFTSKLQSSIACKNVTTVEGIGAEMMEMILDYIYTNNLEISHENVYDVISAADYLVIPPIKKLCAQFLKNNVTTNTCIMDWVVARRYDLDCKYLEYFICRSAESIDSEEIVELSVDDFEALLTLKNQQTMEYSERYERNIKESINESKKFNWILSWLKHDSPNRQKQFDKLSSLVDVDQVPTMCLEELASRSDLTDFRQWISDILRDRKSILKAHGVSFLKAVHSHEKTIIKEYKVGHGGWSNLSSLPHPVRDAAVVLNEERIYVVGGIWDQPSKSSRTVWSLDISETPKRSSGWDRRALLKEARRNFGCTIFQNSIYVAGGKMHDTQWLASVESFDFRQKIWLQKPAMSFRREGLSLVAHDSYLYAIGGNPNKSSVLKVLECYDGKVWKAKSSMLMSRSRCAAVVLNGLIYAIGGNSSICKDLDQDKCYNHKQRSVETYDPTTDKWSFAAQMKKARAGHIACVCKGKIYVADEDSSEVYDPDTKQWEMLEEWNTNLNQSECSYPLDVLMNFIGIV